MPREIIRSIELPEGVAVQYADGETAYLTEGPRACDREDSVEFIITRTETRGFGLVMKRVKTDGRKLSAVLFDEVKTLRQIERLKKDAERVVLFCGLAVLG